MKKVWKCCSALMLALVLFLASGCNPNYREKFEYGDFICIEWGDEQRAVAITDLSEEGKQKRVLIIPEEIKGIKVGGLLDPTKWGGIKWRSDKLEKLYLSRNITVDETTVLYCDNLKAVLVLNFDENYSGIYVGTTIVYYSRHVYESLLEKGWNLYYERPANITYYYNDGRTENYGCYWLDNVPYGSLVDVIPEEPISKGKTFAGWYKEPECINVWDFETDTTPAEKLDEDGNVIYQETALYAKWI